MAQKIYLPERIFDGERFRTATAILTVGDKVSTLLPVSEIPEGIEVVNCPGRTIAPAYKDLQIYGGNGEMFSLFPSVPTLKATYAYCRSGGATAFMATVPTSSPKIMEAAMDAVYEYWEQGLPGLLGLQLEGPYLNSDKRGAHIDGFLQKPDLSSVKELMARGKGTVRMMTVAPECCPDEVIAYLVNQGVLVSAGHSNATYEEAMHGFDLGITTCTHLFNAMSGFKHREPGLVGAAFDSKVYASIISDGVHVNEAAVRIASKVMGRRLFFITDAITAAKTDTYHYIKKEDRIVLEDGTLAGSCLTMEKAVQKAISFGIPPEEALTKATTIPAKVLGKDHKWGTIAPGYSIDWVLLNNDFRVEETIGDPVSLLG